MNPLFTAGVQATRHAVMRTLSVLCVLAVIGLVVFSVHRLINPKPTESYAQSADKIENYEFNYYKPKIVFGLGIDLWGWKFGLYKEATGDKQIDKGIQKEIDKRVNEVVAEKLKQVK